MPSVTQWASDTLWTRRVSPMGSLTSRIDRLYTSALPSLLDQLVVQAKIIGDLASLFHKKISDYAPLLVTFAPRKQ
eukprot:1405015-Alexandrium_andersonii.AAC.1